MARLRAFFERRWAFELAYFIVLVVAVSLILSIVGRRSGWPVGDAYYNELILVQQYAAHFRHLDFFPVWSSSDGLGLGTPVLLFYQKTFFYVSGLLFILFGGALKATLVASIGLFLIVGAYGMRWALKVVTGSRLLWTVGSIGYLFTNYVFTDWLPRGDLPEFAALMIVPWLLYWCLNLVVNRRASLLLIVIVPALVDAHSAIGLISVFTLATAGITFLAVGGWRGLRAIWARVAISVGGAVVLLAPTLLAELDFSANYDPATKVTTYGHVYADFVPVSSYFLNGGYDWLSNTHSLDLQIDFAIWVPIAAALLGLAAYLTVSRPGPRRWQWLRGVSIPGLVFLGASVLIYLLLQLHVSYGIYEVLSPLQTIAYPYRMLTFITPIGVILVVIIGDLALRRFPTNRLVRIAPVLWLVSLIALSPLTFTWTTNYALLAAPGHFPSTTLSTPPDPIDLQHYKGLLTFNGILYDEYLPRVFTADGSELRDDGPLYVRLHQHQAGAASLSDVPCAVVVPSEVPLETLRLTFRVTCAGPTRVALPVSYNASSSLFVDDGGRLHEIPYYSSVDDPRIIVKIATSRPETIVVDLPTLWGILSSR